MTRFLLAFLMLSAGARPQPPPAGFPWWDSPLVRDLNLSEDQRQQIRGVVREHRRSLIDLRAAVEKAEAQLEDVFNEDRVDQRRAGEAIDQLVAARGELTRALSQLSLRLRSILTAEQWRELQKRRETEGPLRRRGPRPGGPPAERGERP